jgi:hypothetical protein
VARARRRASATRNLVDGVDADRLHGRCLFLQERRTEAVACLLEAAERAAGIPHPAAQARVHRDLAGVLAAEGDQTGAQHHLAAAGEILDRLGADRLRP